MLAAPGSGKTRVICYRLHYLIQEKELPPDKMCVITFTRNAAEHMKKQFLSIPASDRKDYSNMFMGTIHSLCYHILTQYHRKRPQILNEKQRQTMIREILNSIYPDRLPDEEVIEEVERTLSIGERFPKLFCLYQLEKQKKNLLDYEDLIREVLVVFKKDELFCRTWQERFSYILVDEFQDVSKMQLEFIKVLGGEKKNVMVVGDDDQAIYGFRGAVPSIFTEFEGIYPGCKRYVLSTNYRSKEEIVKTGMRLIKNNTGRMQKEIIAAAGKGGKVAFCHYENSEQEVKAVMQKVKEAMKTLPEGEKIAILFRKGHQIRAYKKEAQRLGIPCLTQENTKEAKKLNGALNKCTVLLMTMHAAKGMEFHTVFLPELNKKTFLRNGQPGIKEKKESEEERRVLYVAVTRAKINLYLSYSGEQHSGFYKEMR